MTKSTRKSSPRSSRRTSQDSKPTSQTPGDKRSTDTKTTNQEPDAAQSSPGTSTDQASSPLTSVERPRGHRNPLIIVAMIVLVLVAGGYYLMTGIDPLGLFEPPPATQVAMPTVLTPLPGETSEGTPTAVPPAILTTRPTPSPTARSRSSWWEVYFTDPQNVNDPNDLKGSIPEKLIEYIDAAQSTIHIAAFEFDLTPVAEAIIRAKERGVEVQWITDDEYGIEEDKEEGHGQFAMLRKAGIKIRDDGRTALMHNKFWIFDEETVWTGSTNITVNGNFRNNNNVLVLHSSDVAAIYETEFTEMWNKDFGPTSPSSVRLQATQINRTPVQILFAPEDKVISRLVPLIEGAQSSIYFMAFSFTHKELGAAMLARAEAGVDVMGIFETRASETEHSELPILYCTDVPVRQDGSPGTFHHKVIVIDEEIVITGSLNFSVNADESNDENVVVITSRSIADQYLREFKRRWDEGSDPDPQAIQCPK